MTKVNQEERAMLAWGVLTEIAKQRMTLTYSELAEKVGAGGPRACRHFLHLIQTYTMANQLPPMTILVVSKAKKKPGTGFIAHDMDAVDQGMQLVWDYDWSKDGNPFDFTSSGETFESLKKQLLDDPAGGSLSVSTKVKNRGMRQVLFRAAVLEAYGEKCAVTGIAYTELLEACHIVPWAECTPAEQVDPRNGILLNRLHHGMFDRGFMTIDENFHIYIDKEKSRSWGNDQVRHAIAKDVHSTTMTMPADKALWPDGRFIKAHNESFGWEI